MQLGRERHPDRAGADDHVSSATAGFGAIFGMNPLSPSP
jgi:hypothetical protein